MELCEIKRGENKTFAKEMSILIWRISRIPENFKKCTCVFTCAMNKAN